MGNFEIFRIMKIHLRILLFLIYIILCIGCTYERPFLSMRVGTMIFKDSITQHIIKQKEYRYISLRARAVNVAEYFKKNEFDSLGNKIKVSKLKKDPVQHMDDGYARLCVKVTYYSSPGEIEKISKRIFQNRGISGTSKNKTIYYENGKKVKN